MVRNLLRVFSRNRTLKKRLPSDFGAGVVFCSPDAMLSMLKPGWRSGQANALFLWVRRFLTPGMRVWDIGANQGLFALAASAVVGNDGKIIAFEPDLFLAALIEKSLASGTHKGSPVTVLPLALSDRMSVASFSIAHTDRALNHLTQAEGNPRTGGSRKTISVMTATVDWVANETAPPDFLKIDVEGAECLVMEGARHVVQQVRPLIIIEVAAENASRITAFFAETDYRMLDASGKEPRVLDHPAWNTLAVPAERLDEVIDRAWPDLVVQCEQQEKN